MKYISAGDPIDIHAFSKRIVQLLPQLARGLAWQERNDLSRGEITLPQLWALEYLSRQGSSPMNGLAHFLAISRPSATALIDRLITQRLVRREDDARDRRIVRVAISAHGRRTIQTIWNQKQRTLTEVFGKISPSDRAQYLATLERVVEILVQRQRRSR